MRTLSTESRTSRIGRITLDAKQTGERKAGNPPIAFDVAGTGNVAWSRCCDTSQPKGRGNREYKLRPKPARQLPPLTFEQVACMDDSPLPAQGSILGGSSPSEAFRFGVGQLRVEKASHIDGVV